MSIQQAVRAGIEAAFTAVDEFVIRGTYTYRSGAAVYDPATDVMTAGEVTLTDVRMIRATSSAEEREASPVTITDVKVLIPASDLEGHEPSETDVFTLNGVVYNVLIARPVPGDDLWIIMARKK